MPDRPTGNHTDTCKGPKHPSMVYLVSILGIVNRAWDNLQGTTDNLQGTAITAQPESNSRPLG